MGEGFKIQKETPVFDANTYLYNLGDECSALSGGWASNETSGSGNTLTKNTSDITLYSPAGANYIIARNGATVDLTNYSTLKTQCLLTFTGGSSGGFIVRVGSTWASYSVSQLTQSATSSTSFEFSLDVASVNASKYVFILNNAEIGKSATMVIQKIWLEV